MMEKDPHAVFLSAPDLALKEEFFEENSLDDKLVDEGAKVGTKEESDVEETENGQAVVSVEKSVLKGEICVKQEPNEGQNKQVVDQCLLEDVNSIIKEENILEDAEEEAQYTQARRQSLISSFVVPAKKKREDDDLSPQQMCDLKCSASSEPFDQACRSGQESRRILSTHPIVVSRPSTSRHKEDIQDETILTVFSNDVGHYIGQTIDDHTKRILLENPWTPPNRYKFPFLTRTVSGKEVKNYVSSKHLEAHKDWLLLSDVKRGMYCKYCPWFINRNEGGYQKNVPLGALVTKPLTNFKNLAGVKSDLDIHCSNIYRKNAVTSGKDFLRNYHNPRLEVKNLLDESHLSQVQENIQRLIPIVKTIILLGKQNIPLRGHRDDGPILADSLPTKNEDNFRAMLRFRVDAGDKNLENHLKTSSSRAAYISKTVQDQLIECCRKEILDKILNRVDVSGYYSVIFDETPDLSGKAQVSVILRYVDFSSNEPCIREDFVTFIDAFGELTKSLINQDQEFEYADEKCEEDEESYQNTVADNTESEIEELSLTGASLGRLVLKEMKEMNLKLENCVAIGTDGCAVMLGEHGAVKEVQKKAKNAVMMPYFSRKLNNSISKSLKIALIEKASSIMREVTLFFKVSRAKRNTALAHFLGKKLVQLCETRWVERHDAVLQFTVSLPEIVEALMKISQWKNKERRQFLSVLCAAVNLL